MRRVSVPGRLRDRRVWVPLAVVAALVLALVLLAVTGGSPTIRTRTALVAGTPEDGRPVALDTTLYLPAATPAPGVLLTPGFGGDKTSVDAEARTLAGAGYVVLAYSPRGFGASGGLIHLASPDYEIRDAQLLVDHLAALPQIARVGGQPMIAAAGSSYGGGISLLLAAADHRVRAVAADIAWNDLGTAFFPNAAGSGAGPFKKLWAGQLFGDGYASAASATLPGEPSTSPAAGAFPGSVSCGRFAPDVCQAYQASARTGVPTAALQRILAAASPQRVLADIRAPTLLTQGEQDSLFPLSQAQANASGIAAHGTPVRVVFRPGGHDDPTGGTDEAMGAAVGWFGDVFGAIRRGVAVPITQPFRYTLRGGSVSAQTGRVTEQTLQAGRYPAASPGRPLAVRGSAQTITSPAGGIPAVVTSVPGAGPIGAVGTITGISPADRAQTALFVSGPLARATAIVGTPTVRLRVTSSTTSASLFLGLRDLSPDGGLILPSGLISPATVTGLTPGIARTVTLRLPSIARLVPGGDRLVVTAAATDFAFGDPDGSRTYTVALAGAGAGVLRLPTADGRPVGSVHPVGWLITGGAVALLVLLGVVLELRRRRRRLHPDPSLADVPVAVTSLVKEYAGGYRAVDDVTFRVERGQVVGLLGPNGAGKTTVLRVLVGLITPSAGSIHVFGEPVTPGAPVLARLGAFIEGPGFLPHLSGRENLRLSWAATGRPAAEAQLDIALDIAGLGASIDRRVRAYSQGMRQRLGIAAAMLGLPEVLVLDEPTNGLDPPQIAEMREVLRDYAATGRTVLVSSHLLAEVEQTCTHVVVMHRGRLVAAGAVSDIAGTGDEQLEVADVAAATRVLAAAGIGAVAVPARRALEDVFLDLVGDDGTGPEGDRR